MNAPDTMQRTLVFHDLQPMFTSFQPIAAAALGGRLEIFEGGMERRPATAESLQEFVEQQPGARCVAARYVRPALSGAPAAAMRSVLAVAHPIVRMLHRVEHTWTRFAETQSERLPRNADLATVLATGLILPLQRFPYTNFLTGLITGDLQNKGRMMAVGLATQVASQAGIGLVDFPETMAATARRELAAAGLCTDEQEAAGRDDDAAAATEPAASAASPTTLLDTLQHWRNALPAEAWQRICRLNTADLIFFDEIAAVVAREADLSAWLGQQIHDTVEAAASLTQHRSTPPPRQRAEARAAGAAGDAGGANGTAGATATSMIEADPVLGWRLRPNVQTSLRVVDKPVFMQSDDTGCRVVPGQPAQGEHTLAVYGCSCVFGLAVPVEQTACALLQARLPGWRVENHGVNGYGQGQNLLQLMRDLRWNECDFVTFGWIAAHLPRNVADINQVQRQTDQAGTQKAAAIRFMPRASFDERGELRFREVAYSRPALSGLDLSDFSPDPHYLDLVCFALLKRAAALVAQRGGHFFVTVLLDKMSPTLSGMLDEAGIPVLDAAVSGPEHINPFELSHPNGRANVHYADRIEGYLARRLDAATP